MKVSIVMAIWKGDNPQYMELCLDSIKRQTFQDYEVIIVSDGEVCKGLFSTIKDHSLYSHGLIRYFCLPFQGSPSHAWNKGISESKGELIARMDPDDIMVKDRLENQVIFMEKNPNIDLCGGQIVEFNEFIGDRKSSRKVPLEHKDIQRMLRKYNPLNHVSIMAKKHIFKKEKYEVLYGYVDYYLWLRLSIRGVVFENLNEVLCYVRVGNEFGARRTGIKYLKSDFKITKLARSLSIWSLRDCYLYLIPRIFLRLLPPRIFEFIYKIYRNTKDR